MRLDRHPEFVSFLKQLPRTEIALHGLYHCHTGLRIPIEFQNQSSTEYKQILQQIIYIFGQAGIDFVPGICPPGWNAPPSLVEALADTGMRFLASARDTFTPISKDAKASTSGMQNVSLMYPQWIGKDKLIHISSNFHATSPIDRALAIIEHGGLLAIKAHIVKEAFGNSCDDGLDEIYRNYLDVVLAALENRYGDSLWWTSMGQLTAEIFEKQKSK